MADRGARRAAGELESEVLAALWAAGEPLTAADVQRELGGDLAYNTVQTILVRLHRKGMVERRSSGRAHAYLPARGAERWTAERMHELLRRGPDRQAVLRNFVGSLSSADARALRDLLDLAEPGSGPADQPR